MKMSQCHYVTILIKLILSRPYHKGLCCYFLPKLHLFTKFYLSLCITLLASIAIHMTTNSSERMPPPQFFPQ